MLDSAPGLSVPSITSFPYLCSINLLEQCSAGQVDLRMCPGLVFLYLVLEKSPSSLSVRVPSFLYALRLVHSLSPRIYGVDGRSVRDRDLDIPV
ncbi:uncharacterized protein BDZ83DRAFT_629901 [Colletotrichum acutatum]|uniref:Uncharacterized protein n=1 Tax=Glomerella acutata TaxID=27357 RepID=A0AAD8XC36_GLOAC|nr:uncharacterized protein BDZ83DRAFT_629901 [Colletotrichum acutatum]KAK1721478.1 hypothetical protein BDZ83DRAFT_629901 [Colletotrichum acutatum]